jgi:hypothetical protein
MTPWTAAEVADLQAFFAFPAAREPEYRIAENPVDPRASFLPDEFYSTAMSEPLDDSLAYDVRPATDDAPFLRMLPLSPDHMKVDPRAGVDATTAWVMNTRLYRGWLPKDWLHLIGAAMVSVFYGVLFVIVPMIRARARGMDAGRPVPVLVYFSLLGFSFMALELVLIQVFTKLIGYPMHAMATVISVMLIAAALGSLASPRIVGADGRRWKVVFIGLLLSGLLMWLGYPFVSTRLLGGTLPLRIAATVVLIGPMAFFMGMPFPLGLLELAGRPRGAVAWAWSMNGLFTTIGGVVSALLSITFGFRLTILIALATYGLAAVTFARLRQTSDLRVAGTARPAPAAAASPLLPS